MADASLVTGGWGFLGRRVVRALEGRGRQVRVLDRVAPEGRQTIVADLARGPVELPPERFRDVYHLAGLAHVEPRTPAQRRLFAEVNVEGTRRLLDALDAAPALPESLLLVSTVAVYGAEAGVLLDETTERRASDPYGLSKRQAEDLVGEWGARRGVRIAILRLPLVAGPAPPGNLGRMVAAIAAGRYLGVGRGDARRSMVWISDLAAILPQVAEAGGVFHLTDGVHPSFAELEAAIAATLGRRQPPRVPMAAARVLAVIGDAIEGATRRRAPFDGRVLRKMTSTLTFSDERARSVLGWRPTPVLERAAELASGAEPADGACQPPHGRRRAAEGEARPHADPDE